MWWYRHPSFAVTAGGSWFSRFPLVTALFIDPTHRLRSFGLSSLPNGRVDAAARIKAPCAYITDPKPRSSLLLLLLLLRHFACIYIENQRQTLLPVSTKALS